MHTVFVHCPRCGQKIKGEGKTPEEAQQKAEENAAYHQRNSRKCKIVAVKIKKK